MEEDEWRVVDEYPNYFVNRTGEIRRRLRTGRKPLVKVDDQGDRSFTFIDAEGRHERRVVDIVDAAFLKESNARE